MANCTFCGKTAGWFRTKHSDCEDRYVAGLESIQAAAQNVATGAAQVDVLHSALKDAEQARVASSESRAAIVRGWEAAVEQLLEDGLLDEREEQQIEAFIDSWALTPEELAGSGAALAKIHKASVLRDLLAGKSPRLAVVPEGLPFNFQKSEQPVWVFPEAVEYLEDKNRREYVGRSAGLSVRIASGVYYRTGAFKGFPIERTERVSLGRGILAVTTKHVYFAGAKSFRVRHDKIVTCTPFSDGVGIVKDTASAKPQIFVTGDGWFTYNLLSNAARL